MTDFRYKPDNPNNFYTPKNVSDTIDYINKHPADSYNDIFTLVLEWVRSILSGEQYNVTMTDKRLLSAAYVTAKAKHDKAILNKNFIAAVRWRYVMTAISDYIRMVVKKK